MGKKNPVRKIIDVRNVPLPQVWSNFTASDENKADLARFLSEITVTKGTDLPQQCEEADYIVLHMRGQRGGAKSNFKETMKRRTPGWYSIRVGQSTRNTKECWSSA